MGFITKNQIEFQEKIYENVDSDVEAEIDRNLTEVDHNTDKIKRGIERKEDEFPLDEDAGDQSIPVRVLKPWQKAIEKVKEGDLLK